MVNNALKFTSEGSIEAQAHFNWLKSCLVISIKDTGIGIGQNEMHLLFTRFGKLMRTADSQTDGLGLGLTIVKQIVDACQGTINVDSAGINKGSCFSIELPMDVFHEKDDEVEKTNI